MPFITISGSKNIQEVMSTEFKSPGIQWSTLPSIQATLGTQNLFSKTTKQEHGKLRALVGKALSATAVAQAVPTLQQIAKDVLAGCAGKSQVLAADEARRFTQDVAWKQILGFQFSEQEAEEFRATETAWEEGVVSPVPLALPGSPFARSMAARRKLVGLIQEQISRLQTGKDASGPSTLAALVAAEEEGQKLTREEVIDNALLLIFAGSETSSSTLAILTLLLGLHPDVYQKLQLEQRELVKKNGETLSQPQLDSCVYLDAVVREAMRIRPVSNGGSRKATDTLIVDGKQVPKGWNVAYSIGLTHDLDPLTFQEDMSHMDLVKGFKPERWLSSETRPGAEFMPFGAGPRTCIGAPLAMVEIKIFVAMLARMYDISLVDATVAWRTSGFIPKPANGVPIRIAASASGV